MKGLLLTRRALMTLTSRRRQLPDGVEAVVLEDGRADGFEIAWATTDLYGDQDLVRHFFGAVLTGTELKWIQVSNAGVDHPVFAQLVERGVTLTTSHVTGGPIAEYVLRSVLDHYRRAGEWRTVVAERRWTPHDFREVTGTTWLIVGLGAIGSAVAVRAKAFGATVLGVRRTPRGDEPVDAIVDLSAVPRADVVVLAAPLTSATARMVDASFLLSMKPRSVLVNVGRGGLVDEDALHAALDRGVPEAALLDVVDTEPLPLDSWLWSHPSVVLTPHSSALGEGRHERAVEVFSENLRRYLAGEPLAHVAEL